MLPQVTDMLRTQGRMKLLRPLYRNKMGKELARTTFLEARASYPIAQKMVAADLGL